MVKTPQRAALSLMGLNIQGDIGPWTCYRSRHKRFVMFLKAPPKQPPSLYQRLNHDRWKAAAEFWRHLTDSARSSWRQLAVAARLRITGYNLFVYWFVTGDRAAVDTLIAHHAIDPFNPE